MIELARSGLPLYLNEKNYIMALSAELKIDGYGRKFADQMKELFVENSALKPDDPIYDVYRNIRLPKDEARFIEQDIRYDITIIMEGAIAGERKKTSGHYHGYNPEKSATYAEVYEVIQGAALYVLQRADNFNQESEPLDICEILLATVQEGETIIIPPNYGHCSINIGSGPLVFSNLAYAHCPIDYAPVMKYHGMGYYIFEKGKRFIPQKNNHYESLPDAKMVRVKEMPELGIEFGKPIYQSFAENPDAFNFLRNPAPYANRIREILE